MQEEATKTEASSAEEGAGEATADQEPPKKKSSQPVARPLPDGSWRMLRNPSLARWVPGAVPVTPARAQEIEARGHLATPSWGIVRRPRKAKRRAETSRQGTSWKRSPATIGPSWSSAGQASVGRTYLCRTDISLCRTDISLCRTGDISLSGRRYLSNLIIYSRTFFKCPPP